ncbi:MAG: electron transport complex subunit RsxC [Clostridia bacterium]|nr:electron transport complex subunit RsxC [Clostridia bacterium]
MAFTFRGGTHLNEHKNTRKCSIEILPPPKYVFIPMSQHIGVQCVPGVKPGDHVDKGQIIGEVEKGLGCPVHASVSGTVSEIRSVNNAMGAAVNTVVIENDFQDTVYKDVHPFEKSILDATPEEIVEVVRKAGIAGMGGATFPTYAKISSAIGKADKLIVNCAECEPYITANHRLMLEHPERIVGGVKILLKAFGLRTGMIAVEDNKMDAVKAISEVDYDPELIRICVMKTKYPQGDERQIIYALTGKELPAGKLPADLGCVIFNAETCAAVYNAFTTGMPLVERIVTVDGDCVKKPGNLLCPIGTPFSVLIEHCEGDLSQIKTLIAGGPMMGFAQWDVNTPVIKGTSAVLAMSKAYEKKGHAVHSSCIRCGNCVANCPMHLLPRDIYKHAISGELDACEKLYATSCVECGTCSYNCPAGLELTQYIRTAKSKIIEQKRAAAKKAAEERQKAALEAMKVPQAEADDRKPKEGENK